MKTGLSDIGSPVFFIYNDSMSTHSVSIQSARLSQMGVNRQVLKEGSSVLVRVIGERGGGKYEGSVAGVRVQLSSSKPLRAGDSFVATVGIKNGTIVVTPKEMPGISQISLTFNEVSQNQLYSLLESLGLPADNLSSSILQSFKQMGLKMDSGLANKIRNLALRFSGKEKSAAEILSLLAQKGIDADEQEIKELLMLLTGNAEDKNDAQSNQKSKEKLINKINSTEGAWYLLPFELIQIADNCDAGVENRSVLGNGCIRLLFNSVSALKLLNLDCNYNNQKYLFSLSYERNKIKNTYFNVSGAENPENQIISLKKHFIAAGVNPGKIVWAEKEELEGNASGLETFVTFGGEV